MPLRLALATALLTLIGCAPPPDGRPDASEEDSASSPDAGPNADAGPERDGGGDDAGTGEDAAAGFDAGRDAGSARTDAGRPRVDAGPPAPTVLERTYRILHWNIAGGAENGCATAGITRAVRRYVAENDVDFVGLNEVCPAQHDAIEAALRAEWGLGGRVQFGAYVGDGLDRIVGNSIFSRFGVENVTRHHLGHDQYGDRNLLCAQVPSLTHVRFCSAHLTPADSVARTQMATVLDRIEQWWMNRSDTVILSGDLNLNADHPGLDPVYSSAANTRNNGGNRGRYRELDDADPDHCIGYGERSHAGSGGPCGEGGKIDFIFVRENRIVDGNYGADTFDVPTDCTGACSDHRAVFGRVRVRVLSD